MRTELGIVGVTVLLVVAGQGILLGLGLVQMRGRSLLASAGLAYLAGAASTLLLGILLLTLGGEMNVPVFTGLALLLGGAGAALAWRRGREPAAPVSRRPAVSRSQLMVVALAAVLVAAVLVMGLLDAGIRPLAEWDSWSIWTRKAVVLTSSGLDGQVFAGAPYAFSHLDYPILLPLFESVYFRAMGGVDAQAVHAVLWILYVATLGALAYLGSRFTRVWVWLPVVLALALGGQFYTQLLTAYADVPMGLLAVPGVLCLGLWLRDLDWRYLTLGALLLAAAASVKNEGLLLMLACFVAAAIVLAVARSWRTLGRLGIGFAGVLAALAPWQIWVKAHDIKGNLPVGKGLDPGYLSDHSDRVSPTVKALLPMLESGGLSYVIPLGLAIALLGLATRGLRPVSAFYLLAALGTFASVVWAFVISPDTIEYQIATSANRVIMGVAFVALAGLLHICGLLDGHRTVAADEHDADTAVHEPPPPSESAVRARDTAPA